jgi:hypothetical protein
LHLIFAVISFLSILASPLLAQERPTTGLVHNTTDPQSLTYECNLDGADLICTFTQSAISRQSTEKELPNVISTARNAFPEWQKTAVEECRNTQALDNLIAGRPPADADRKEFDAAMARMTPGEKADMNRMFKALIDLCKDKSEARYIDMARINHEREARSCRVWTSTFKQRFRRVGTGVGTWVVIDSPMGDCGVVNVSRWESEISSGITFWNYYSKKVVTNKSGKILPTLSCSSLDENEYRFDWRSIDRKLGCDYIKFGF